MRFGGEAADGGLFDAVSNAFDAIAVASAGSASTATLASAWRVVAELGFAPATDICGECHAPIAPDATTMFSHAAGGTLCQRCGRTAPAGRLLPPDARHTLRQLLYGDDSLTLDEPSARAHQRLLREFLAEHLSDGRPLR